MKIKTIIFFLLIFGLLNSQTLDTIHWRPKVLTWDNFKGTPPINPQIGSRLNFFIEYEFGSQSMPFSLVRFEVHNYMNEQNSWINSSYKNSLTLLYNQTIFDIAELYARRIQYELNRTTVNFLDVQKIADSIYYDYFFICQDEINRFQFDTDYGMKDERVEFWADSVNRDLEVQPMEIIPPYVKSEIGYGFDFIVGTGAYTNGLNDYLKIPFKYGYGFEASYKDFILYLRTTIGSSSLLKDFYHSYDWPSYKWPSGYKISTASFESSIGYLAIKKESYQINPFAGIGWYALSPNTRDSLYIDQNLSNYSAVFGINLDYKIGRNITFNYKMKEETFLNIRARLYVITADLSDEFKGASINFGLGLSGLGNLIKIKN